MLFFMEKLDPIEEQPFRRTNWLEKHFLKFGPNLNIKDVI